MSANTFCVKHGKEELVKDMFKLIGLILIFFAVREIIIWFCKGHAMMSKLEDIQYKLDRTHRFLIKFFN